MQVMVLPDGSTLNLVHWTYLDGRWKICCAPHVEANGNWMRTDDPRAANCPHCKATDRWKAAMNGQPGLATNPEVHWADQGRTACMSQERHRSEDPRVVSCPHCRATERWQEAAAIQKPLPNRIR